MALSGAKREGGGSKNDQKIDERVLGLPEVEVVECDLGNLNCKCTMKKHATFAIDLFPCNFLL